MTYENPDVEIASLRANLAKANCTIADLRHVLKAHGSHALREGLLALSEFRNRVVESVAPEQRQSVEETYVAMFLHFDATERVLRAQECACGELAPGEQSLEDSIAGAREARAEAIEKGFLNAGERPRGKVISLGSRVRSPRLYEQSSGEPLHPSNADCYAGATDDGRDPKGAA